MVSKIESGEAEFAWEQVRQGGKRRELAFHRRIISKGATLWLAR